MKTHAGMGDAQASLRVWMANRPPLALWAEVTEVLGLQQGEIAAISSACGNGWRKVFNVYAKLIFALPQSHFAHFKQAEYPDWQAYRDHCLLRFGSHTALLFNQFSNHALAHVAQYGLPAKPSTEATFKPINLIMGRTYAKSLAIAKRLIWIDQDFAFNREQQVIVCPYFDYRQLSNQKIIRLTELMFDLMAGEQSIEQSACAQRRD
jgi:hypothetical protein